MAQANIDAEQWLPAHLSALKSLWTDQLAAGKMPAEIFFCDAVMKPWQNNTAFIARDEGGRYYVERSGLGLIRRTGREASGSYIDMLAHDIASTLIDGLSQCYARATPYIMRTRIAFGESTGDHIDLILPAELTPNDVRHFVFSSYELSSAF